MNKTAGRAGVAVLALALTTTGLVSGGASAQPVGSRTTQSTAARTHTTTVKVVANGLNTPRGLVYDRAHHRVLVAEAGLEAGDTGPCTTGEEGTPLCFGPTGSIFQYSENGGFTGRRVTHLPSEAIPGGGAVLGLHDLSLYRGRLTAVFGLLGTTVTRTGLGPDAGLMGQVAHVRHSGNVTAFGDIPVFEEQLYGANEESDAYGVLTGRFGTVVVNPGGHEVHPNGIGGNDLLRVKRDGTISTIAAFPERQSTTDPTAEIESVPTCVARGPDGAFYVGELTGYPYYPGEARVWRVVPGHRPTIYAQGFTNIIDCTFDHKGRLIVLEIAHHGLLDPNQTGALIRVRHNGDQTILASHGLTNPGGVAVVGHGVFYVTNFTASTDGTGELLRVTLHSHH
ncbi:MAG: ScyD/ScyE family protein [Nocardioidaceae bacterium]